MSKHKGCAARRFVDERRAGNCWCELDKGHEGPHAAFTWEGCNIPRVEWSDAPTPSPTAKAQSELVAETYREDEGQ